LARKYFKYIFSFFKRTLDEQLRTAVQSQLESIKTGIAQLQISIDSMKTVERTMRETDEKLQKIAPLQSKLEDLRHEANTYRYYLSFYFSVFLSII
jgi:uncharacterized protein YhaN